MTAVTAPLDVTTVTVLQVEIPSTVSSVSIYPTPDDSSVPGSVISFGSTDIEPSTQSTGLPSSLPQIKTSTSSQALYPYNNSTRTASAQTSTITVPPRGHCTGCAIAALNPVTTSYLSNLFGNWTSLVVTETVVTEFITYVHNSTVDTVVTEVKTVNQTKTVADWITDTAAEFNVYLPTPGLDLTLDVGPTYVIYTRLYGGPDVEVTSTARNNATDSNLLPTQVTCKPHVSRLQGFIPTGTADWNFFIQTFANGSTLQPNTYNSPVPVPTKLKSFLAQDPDVQVHFQGADIATCSEAGSEFLVGDPSRTLFAPPPPPPSAPAATPEKPTATATHPAATSFTFAPPVFSSIPGTNTFLSTTFLSTSKYITKQGCLRCDTNAHDRPEAPNTDTDNINGNAVPSKGPDPKTDDTPKGNGNTQIQPQNTQVQPQNTPVAPNPGVKVTQSIPDFISSVISDNPDLTRRPEQPTAPVQTITIGDSVVTVQPQPTDQGQGQPGRPSNAPTMVIIGTQTVTVGQTTTINGVPVVVPTAGGGSTIIVGDKTIGITPDITPAPMPVLTVGHNTITANPQGQFVVGTQTLQRGGPIVVIEGHTLTLGPNGKIAIWNSDTQTLATMVGGQPAVTFGGHQVTAQIVGGTTQFVLGDKTLAPGGSAVTIDGTTFSLPPGSQGTSIVINGATQRLSPGLPVLTLNNSPVTAAVEDGTTAFVLAPGQTLIPGGSLVVDGTTYSLPPSGGASTILINGVTSLLNPSPLPVLPFGVDHVTGTMTQGTTAFIFGPDMTLTPGGVVTVSGTTISYPASASGSVVVINGVTSTLGSGSGIGTITVAPPIVVEGKTLTASVRDGTTEYVLNAGTTLLPGGQVIVSGTTYSLAPGGTAVVVDGKTSLLSSEPASNSAGATTSTTSERGAGDFIASGIGETSKSRGGASWAHGGVDKWMESLVMGLAGWLLWLL